MLKIGLGNSEVNRPGDNNKNEYLLSLSKSQYERDSPIKLKLNVVKQKTRADPINSLLKWFEPLRKL